MSEAELTEQETSQLFKDLKTYAFGESLDFRDGISNRIKIIKEIAHPTIEVPVEIKERVVPYIGKTCFVLVATREGGSAPIYHFEVSGYAERALDHLPEYLKYILPKYTKKYLKRAIKRQEQTVTEIHGVTFEIGEDEPDIIEVSQSYSVECDGEVVHETDENEVRSMNDGKSVAIPNIEAEYTLSGVQARIWVQAPIIHERLDSEADRVENEFAFREIVDPEELGDYDPLVSNREAARRIRAIIKQMRTGRLSG